MGADESKPDSPESTTDDEPEFVFNPPMTERRDDPVLAVLSDPFLVGEIGAHDPSSIAALRSVSPRYGASVASIPPVRLYHHQSPFKWWPGNAGTTGRVGAGEMHDMYIVFPYAVPNGVFDRKPVVHHHYALPGLRGPWEPLPTGSTDVSELQFYRRFAYSAPAVFDSGAGVSHPFNRNATEVKDAVGEGVVRTPREAMQEVLDAFADQFHPRMSLNVDWAAKRDLVLAFLYDYPLPDLSRVEDQDREARKKW